MGECDDCAESRELRDNGIVVDWDISTEHELYIETAFSGRSRHPYYKRSRNFPRA